MTDALIIDAVRTPMGRYRGALAGVRPDDLAAQVISAPVERTGLDPAAVDRRVLGRREPGRRGQPRRRPDGRPARGLPVEVPGVTVNRLCASGLEAVNQAARAVKLGEGDLYLAGGVRVDEPRAVGGGEAASAACPAVSRRCTTRRSAGG